MKYVKSLITLVLMAGMVFAVGCKPEDNNDPDPDVRVMTYDPQDITPSSAKCGGDVIAVQGLSLNELGVCWSKEENPTVEDFHSSTTNWNTPYVCTITDLEPNTVYHVRAYALRGLVYYYGEDKSFTTTDGELPTVITSEVTNNNSTSATCGGIVTSDGGSPVSEYGVCINVYPDPTIDDFHYNCGSGVGSFSIDIFDLVLNKYYYVRAYAINQVGVSYGEQVVFNTCVPSIFAISDPGYLYDGQVIDVNVEYPFGFRMTSDIEELARLDISINEEPAFDTLIAGNLFEFRSHLLFTTERMREIIGEAEIVATVTDVAGRMNQARIRVSINEENLLFTTAFTWIRNGALPATGGLEDLGLKWEQNAKDIYAVIKPLEGATLIRFPSSIVWETVTTEATKAAVFSEYYYPISSFSEVSCTQALVDYDIVIGTIYEGEYHLIHITRSRAYTTKGYEVVIEGEHK